MEDRYTETHKTWNKIAQLYEDVFMDLELYKDTYKKFCDLLSRKDASILEIGCGPGRFSEYLTKYCKRLIINDLSDAIFFNHYKNKKNVIAIQDNIRKFLIMNCKHVLETDYIDIDPEQSQKVLYCTKCMMNL